MKKLFLALAVAVVVYQLALRGGLLPHEWTQATSGTASSETTSRASLPSSNDSASRAGGAIADAYEHHRHGVQVETTGVVEKVLADDNDGSRHQRFIVRVPSGPTILIAHNIDLAPRVESLREGDSIEVSGEYEWNNKGGVVHWTHRDPSGRHVAGWIKYAGRTYQ
ncbi:MAG TPA: DUF3465 domain-containing protein [Steroidobacteraceae bacterium]|nr:DUF3465 domain-containing protein [Steroidobacteraceae bacterium]